jgi:hypothetical protein
MLANTLIEELNLIILIIYLFSRHLIGYLSISQGQKWFLRPIYYHHLHCWFSFSERTCYLILQMLICLYITAKVTVSMFVIVHF